MKNNYAELFHKPDKTSLSGYRNLKTLESN